MALSSMTGFARAAGTLDRASFAWELKTVNGRGLDVRLRLPPGLDALDAPARERLGRALSRGSVQATLTVDRPPRPSRLAIDETLLATLAGTARKVAEANGLAPPSIDGLLQVRGVVELIEEPASEAEEAALSAAVLSALETALADLKRVREREGAALHAVVSGQIDRIDGLVARAVALPQRRPEAIRRRLAEQVAALLESHAAFDLDRLHQEAVLLATKTDVQEELDRLTAHVAHARRLLAEGGAVGRKLDFLAQEFNREANTTVSKSFDRELTEIGLDLKATIDQMREQVQNLE